jgi:hypothetical protein
MVHFALFLVKISINFSPSYSTASLMNLLLKVMQDGVNFTPSLPGGFHMVKEMIHKKHSLTEEIVRLAIQGYWTMPSPQEMFLHPSNPNNFEEEEPQCVLAILCDAVCQCMHACKRKQMEAQP